MSEDVQPAPRGGPLRKLYAWMMENAKGPHAWWALAAFAFAESSFFPVPADLMLLPMMLADRKRAFLLALWATFWSVSGGVLGYAIGSLFWDSAGMWLIGVLHISLSDVDSLRQEYSKHAYLIIAQGLTPIPYKLVTISSGLASVPFASFMAYSVLARGIRYIVLEGSLVYWFGAQAQILIEKYMEAMMIGVLALIVLGIVLVHYAL